MRCTRIWRSARDKVARDRVTQHSRERALGGLPSRPPRSQSSMQNPHAERQDALLRRIIKNVVQYIKLSMQHICTHFKQESCTETIEELNRCLDVRPGTRNTVFRG